MQEQYSCVYGSFWNWNSALKWSQIFSFSSAVRLTVSLFSSMKDAVKTLSSIWVKYFVPVWKAQDFQPDF